MADIKRVWDSKKRAVRQGKEQVWLVDGEKKVNTNHGFAEATGTDVVYDSSWETAQEPLQVYDKGWEEVGGGESGATITSISQQYLEIPNRLSAGVNVYFTPENADTSNITATSTNPGIVDVVNMGQETGVIYFQISAGADSGSGTVTFSDGTNNYNCEVTCTPFINVESIGEPSRDEIYVSQGNTQRVTFNYYPEQATNPPADITITANNAGYGYSSDNGQFDISVYYQGTDVDGTISYYLNSDPETVYTITVHNVTPTVSVESLSGIPETVSQLEPEIGRTFIVTYLPEDADEIESQIEITYGDSSIVDVSIRNIDPSTHTFLLDYYGKAEGSTEVYFYLNGNLVAQTGVTIEYPATTTISIDEDGVNGTVTRTGNGWVQNSDTGYREIQGLVSDTTITPSDNSGTYILTIDDGQDTNTLEIVPDNFDDYVYRGLDGGLEITQAVNIQDLPGFGGTTYVYPTTTAATPE